MPGLGEFFTALAVATPALLAVWAVWGCVKQDVSSMRRDVRRLRERHISNQARIALTGVSFPPPPHPNAPTMQERLDKAFYQAWIEPTEEIIAKIDVECTPEPPPEPDYSGDAECYCVPCESDFERDESIRLNAEITLRNERIKVLEARLKEMVDYAIEQNLRNAHQIDIKRVFR